MHSIIGYGIWVDYASLIRLYLIEREKMAYASISHWTITEWNDELESIARDKFVPLIMSVGASRVQMIKTSDLTFSVVTEYPNKGAADAAQAKVAEIRAQAAQELPMTMASMDVGDVFASS